MRDIVTKTLYRSLLRVARNFESPSPIGSIVSSLLYRHGRDDWIDYERLSGDLSLSKSETSKSFDEESYNFNQHFASKQSPHLILYKSLLREILGGPKVHMKFAIQTKERKLDFLTSVIQREFRNDESSKSFHFGATNECRKKVGFMAYKELNQKLKWAETMGLRLLHDSSLDADANDLVTSGSEEDDIRITQNHVSVLWKQPPSTYLQPGCFLVAHPLLTGIFNQSVICILDHSISNKDDSKTASSSEKKNNDDSRGEDDMSQGTYGLILNHPFMVDETKYDKDPNPNHIISISERERQLNEIIRNDCLPEGMKVAFGNFPVRNGGPVNMSVQMLRIAEPTQESNLQIGGTVLPEIQVVGTNHEYSTAINDDRAIYFGGDIIKASQAVIDGDMKKESFSFFVGASCWEEGQLESEIERGYWIPCSAPPLIAFTGRLASYDQENEKNCGSDLWLRMMSYVSKEDGILAKIILESEFDENSYPCDDFKS